MIIEGYGIAAHAQNQRILPEKIGATRLDILVGILDDAVVGHFHDKNKRPFHVLPFRV